MSPEPVQLTVADAREMADAQAPGSDAVREGAQLSFGPFGAYIGKLS